jgi:hypothetical protein
MGVAAGIVTSCQAELTNRHQPEVQDMNIAQQIKAFYVAINPANGSETFDKSSWEIMIEDCEEIAQEVDQDWDNETTSYTFYDGSVLVICNRQVSVYGAKQ